MLFRSLIGYRKGITENISKLFPHLIKFFEKYEQVFGSSLQAFNAYIYYGQPIFAADKNCIEYVINIGTMSMFSTKEIMTINNFEGALLMQMLLQSIGDGLLNSYIPIIIEKTIQRLNMEPITDYLVRELYNVILCCICNNPQITLEKIELLGITEKLFTALFTTAPNYKNSYDIKVLVIGLSHILIQSAIPPFLTKSLATVIQVIIVILESQMNQNIDEIPLNSKRKLELEEENNDDSFSRSDENDESSFVYNHTEN